VILRKMILDSMVRDLVSGGLFIPSDAKHSKSSAVKLQAVIFFGRVVSLLSLLSPTHPGAHVEEICTQHPKVSVIRDFGT
jgi:hypothetical protein